MPRKSLYAVLFVIGVYGGIAHGQAARENGTVSYITLTAAYVRTCGEADTLLRNTCARIGDKLNDRNKQYCQLPAVSFEVRTARPYAEFKETYRVEFKEHDAEIAKLLAKTGKSFDAQFANVRAGKVSMDDLESLNRILGDRCVTVEKEWLVPGRRKK